MIDALESFKYMILSEEPLYAKRDGAFSMNVLDCALKLTITFRQSSPTTTTVIFNYTMPLSMVTKGDLHTIDREAEALIALASRSQIANDCVMCGTNNAGDSRFCRGCGAPNVGSLPAELEVMRLTAGARAGQQTIVAGAIIILSILAIALPLIFLGRAKRETIGWVLLILGQVTGWAVLLYGILRMHRTLNPKTMTEPFQLLDATRSIPSVEAAALPPQSARVSVTEGTTELLGSQLREQSVIPAERASAETGEMN